MEILFRGTAPTEKLVEGKCTNCKTVVRFEVSEGKIVYDQRDGNSVKVTCPVCGNQIWGYL